MSKFDSKELHDEKKLDPIERLEDSPFKVLIQNSNDVIQIISPDGTYKYVSPVIEQVLGYNLRKDWGRIYLKSIVMKNHRY